LKKAKTKKKKWLYRDALFSSLLSLIAFALLSVMMLSTSYFNPLIHTLKDFSFLDVFYEGNFVNETQISGDIVLINVEDYDRKNLALLIETINNNNPQVIGVDLIFKEKKINENDSLLAKALSYPKVITTYINRDNKTLGNAAIFKSPDQASGFVNFDAEGQAGVVRKIQGVQNRNGKLVYAFTSQIIRNYNEGAIWLENELEKSLISKRRIKYYGHYKDFEHYNGTDFLTMDNKSVIEGKLVLLGYLGSPLGDVYDVEDKHFTPLNKNPSGKGIPDMYGLTIHANVLNMMLLNDFFVEIGLVGEGLLILLFTYLASLYFIWLDRKLKISYRTVRKLVLFVFAFLFVGLCLWLFRKDIVIEPTLLIMITIFSAGFVKYYKHLVRYINTKRKFKTYLK